MAVIVILALVALFIGLRLYSVLGERTGHEQQPILKPAESDARAAPPVSQPAVTQPAPADTGDLAYVPTAGPGVRAILAADPSFDVARFLEGAKSAYQMVLDSYWKGDAAGLRPFVDDHVFETFNSAIEQREKVQPAHVEVLDLPDLAQHAFELLALQVVEQNLGHR